MGIWTMLILGNPAETRGRNASGLKRGARTAGLPAGCELFTSSEREQGDSRPGYGRALGRLFASRLWRTRRASKRSDFCPPVTRLPPVETGFCTSRERAA